MSSLILSALRILAAPDESTKVLKNYKATLYHGSVKPIPKFDVSIGRGRFGNGLYLATERRWAEFHARGGRQGKAGQKLSDEQGYVYQIEVSVPRALMVLDEEGFYKDILADYEPAEDEFSNSGDLDRLAKFAADYSKEVMGCSAVIFDPKEADVVTPFPQVLILDNSVIKKVGIV